MLKASELDTNKIINEIKKSELGILLVEKDTEEPNFLDVLLSSAGMKMGMMNGKGDTISCHILPIMYKYNRLKNVEEGRLMPVRFTAIKDLFTRWTEAGYNTHNAKDMFKCKAFAKYYKSLKYLDADYLLVCKADNEQNPDIKLN